MIAGIISFLVLVAAVAVGIWVSRKFGGQAAA
jgi:hypothetical protein